MKTYKLPVSWECYGILEIEAESFDDFMDKVNEFRIDDDCLEIPTESYYVDASFEINEDDEVIKVING